MQGGYLAVSRAHMAGVVVLAAGVVVAVDLGHNNGLISSLSLVGQAIRYELLGKDVEVCKQGQPSAKFFIILSGSLAAKLFVPAAKADLTLNFMSAGTSFGQLGVLRNRPVRSECARRLLSCVLHVTAWHGAQARAAAG